MMSAQRSMCWLALLPALAAAGCEEAPATTRTRGSGGGGAKKAAVESAADAAPVVAEALVYKDDDFVESDRNRDPFRAYSGRLLGSGSGADVANPQRPVVMPHTAVEEMSLIAIISGMPRPKAMVVDSSGVGYVIERGDYLGRAKLLQSSGNVAMTLNWRVDRIRENAVVLTRQDPTDPTRPPLSRVIALNEEVVPR